MTREDFNTLYIGDIIIWRDTPYDIIDITGDIITFSGLHGQCFQLPYDNKFLSVKK